MKKNSTAFIILWFIWSVSQVDLVQNYKGKSESLSYVFTKGDFIIGGLSPVHFSPTEAEEQQNPNSFTCQGLLNTRGFEAVEAMLFTMDMINEGPLKDIVLPNITIGMDIKDTCGSGDYAVRESLNFSFIRNAHVQECSGTKPPDEQLQTVAVVGAAYSGVSMAVTNLCGLFYVPVVSYASTSSLLSNQVRFRYFLRTVPNDMLQAKVMADLVRAMKWNYVITLASDSEYGRSGIEAFKHALASFGNSYDVCIPVDERFTKRSTDQEFEKIFGKMKANPKARVVILFAQLHDADILINKFRQHKYMAKEKYVWVGSDAWADSKQVLKGNEDILRGMFGVVPEVVHIQEFDKYFTNFNDKRRKRNPWMREYEYLKVAHNPAFYRQTFRHYPKAQYVMDAVLAIAYALHNMLGCQSRKDCSSKISQKVKQQGFLNYLESVRFPGKSREYFSFNELGDAIGVYDIRHLQLGGGNYEVVKAGKWGAKECDVFGTNASKSSCLDLDMKIMKMVKDNLKNHTEKGIPFSTCSKACPPGFHKNPEKNHAKCCWECRPCSGNAITNQTNMDDCTPCPRGDWANHNHSRCEPIEPTSLHWRDTLGVIIICISGAGILAVICTFTVYYIYRQTPVVRASSKELCYILLVGIAWCYVTPIVFLVDRTDQVCRAIPFVTGLCPSLIAGTLLTKTNRISRIFNRKLLKTGTPSFLSKKWQLLMVICLAVVECLIGGGCVLFSETGSRLLISETKKEVWKQCIGLPNICTAIWWVYNAGLALTCTYQAFRTRKLPENYNETKFITFTMVITCIVVTIFIPTYIGTQGIYRTTITCFVFIIGGSATLCCMFVPKLYIILWRPEKNVPMQPRSSTIRLGTISPSASFVRRLSVDSNAERVKEGRQQRIHSLPSIEITRTDGEGGNSEDVPKFKKTKRSFSLSPDMLSRARSSPKRSSERNPRTFPARRRASAANVQYPASMDMIEEDCELEQVLGTTGDSDDAVFESQELVRGLEQLKPQLYDRDKSTGSLDVEEGDCDYHENDVLLFSTMEDRLEEKANCEEGYTTYKGRCDNDNSTTCTLNKDDFLGETESGSNPKMHSFPGSDSELGITCQHCGNNFTKTNKDILLRVLRGHLSNNGRSQTGEKGKNRILNKVNNPQYQNYQNDNVARKRKTGIAEVIAGDERLASSGLDVNDNRPVKRQRNPSYYRCESLSLPSLIAPFSEGRDSLDFKVMASKKAREKHKRFLPNRKNYIPREDDVKSKSKPNGDVCRLFINGESDEFKTVTDELLCEDGEAETVL